MKIIEILKNKNRILLELNTGILFWMFVTILAGMALPLHLWNFSRVEWLMGIASAAIMAMISVRHMYRCTDRALDFDEGTASKLIFRGYLIRYLSVGLVLVTVALAGISNPVFIGIAYLLILKVAVYSQPFTHKCYNRLFHETEPEAEPLVEEQEAQKS